MHTQAAKIAKRLLLQLIFGVASIFLLKGVELSTTGIAKPESDRLITRLRRVDMPVAIKNVKTKKGIVEIGRKFSDEDDWFNELIVRIENKSGKTIVYLGGGFLFLRPTYQTTPPRYHRFMYGHHPRNSDEAGMTHTTINVKPGETFDIMISASEYVSIKQKLDDLGYPPSIKEIGFNLEEIYFDDGTAWSGGMELSRS